MELDNSNNAILKERPKKYLKISKHKKKPTDDINKLEELSNTIEFHPQFVCDINKYRRSESSSIYQGNSAHGGIVTDLFRGNPQIPRLPSLNVIPIKEEVFSSDSFRTLNIHPNLVPNLDYMGFSAMTMVQKLSLPHLLAGKDVLMKSQTGSGKTLAYAVNIVHNLMSLQPKIKREEGCYALVIVPTRELAVQSYQWFEKLCRACVWVVPGYLMGGEKKKSEKARIRKGISILVATPGRLDDHINSTEALTLQNVKYLVIDEADRLLDMGYGDSVARIIEYLSEQQQIPSSRHQTILLSATLTSDVEKLAGMSLKSPVYLDVSSVVEANPVPKLSADDDNKRLYEDHGTHISSGFDGTVMVTPQNLSHHYTVVPAKLRLVTLFTAIMSKCLVGKEKKMLIFMATQDMVDYHTILFKILYHLFTTKPTSVKPNIDEVISQLEKGDEIEEEVNKGDSIFFFKLHGNMTQKDRLRVFKIFSTSEAGVLLCTDVASRGLDLPHVSWIIQYNAASTPSEYVHRVGRTARVNLGGSALVFLAPSEVNFVTVLANHQIKMTEIKIKSILKKLTTLPLYLLDSRARSKDMEEVATKVQVEVEHLLLENEKLHQMGVEGYASFVRSYASYSKDVRKTFCFKDLHLGHFAKSFGLRDTPTVLGSSLTSKHNDEKEATKIKKSKQKDNMKTKGRQILEVAVISEFQSGLD